VSLGEGKDEEDTANRSMDDRDEQEGQTARCKHGTGCNPLYLTASKSHPEIQYTPNDDSEPYIWKHTDTLSLVE
jgi:hypothetical protein